MNCVKILLLVSLLPLVLRGVSLLGNVFPSPEQPSSSTKNGGASASVSSAPPVGPGRLSGGFSQRRFGGDGFRDDKRFSPTGSNPLHNL
ncbi:hypothetical protein BS78_09G067300 [Paspalum vaginatum]|nr:hypothetical protein BS78_09G067300 [Paspalum vaginatum]